MTENSMLLTLDVGNTNTVLGLYRLASEELVTHWRISTLRTQTADEYGVLFLNLFSMRKVEATEISSIIISSVVPPLESTLRQVCERYFNVKPIFVEPGIKTGMPILVDNPAELGADRLVNGVAAFARYGGPCIVVDFGTATTFDVISAKGEYLGGVISPGLAISAEALFARAFAVNVTGAFLMSRWAIPGIVRSGGGSIIHVASQMGSVARRLQTTYSATKAALLLLAKGMALDHAADGIRVNTLSPGGIATESMAERWGDMATAEREWGRKMHPLGRLGRVEEIASAAAFLASDEASFMTGADLLVDGGYTAL